MSFLVPLNRLSLSEPRVVPVDASMKAMKWNHLNHDTLILKVSEEQSQLQIVVQSGSGPDHITDHVSQTLPRILHIHSKIVPPKIVYSENRILWKIPRVVNMQSKAVQMVEQFQIRLASRSMPVGLFELLSTYFVVQESAKKTGNENGTQLSFERPATQDLATASPTPIRSPPAEFQMERNQNCDRLVPLKTNPTDMTGHERLKTSLLRDYQNTSRTEDGAFQKGSRPAMSSKELQARRAQQPVELGSVIPMIHPNFIPVNNPSLKAQAQIHQTDDNNSYSPSQRSTRQLDVLPILQPDQSQSMPDLLGQAPFPSLIDLDGGAPATVSHSGSPNRQSAMTATLGMDEGSDSMTTASNLIGLHDPWSDPEEDQFKMKVDERFPPMSSQSETHARLHPGWTNVRGYGLLATPAPSVVDTTQHCHWERADDPQAATLALIPAPTDTEENHPANFCAPNAFTGRPFKLSIQPSGLYDLDDKQLQQLTSEVMLERGFELLCHKLSRIIANRGVAYAPQGFNTQILPPGDTQELPLSVPPLATSDTDYPAPRSHAPWKIPQTPMADPRIVSYQCVPMAPMLPEHHYQASREVYDTFPARLSSDFDQTYQGTYHTAAYHRIVDEFEEDS